MSLEQSSILTEGSESGAGSAAAVLPDATFEQARSHYQLARFSQALVGFQSVMEKAQKNGDRWLEIECLASITLISLEQENKEELLRSTMHLHLLRSTTDLPGNVRAKLHYILGVLSYTDPQGPQSSLQEFQLSVDICLPVNDLENLSYAIYGVANALYRMNEYDRCLKELDKLDQILQYCKVADLRGFALLLRGFIHRNRKQTEQAIAATQKLFDHLRVHPNVYLYLQTLYALGTTYFKSGDPVSAQIYLELAKSTCSPSELPRTSKVLANALDECLGEVGRKASFDVSFDSETGLVVRKGMGQVSLQGQFVLRDLLTLFLTNPGVTFSKEDLVEKIWQESYSPQMHDNKIYVTLKRLRQALEPIFPDTESIMRSRNGYSFNHRMLTFQLPVSEKS
jgi:tetratricopeptide (TPR) repeat protein/DNA-binding winged helix-turn-helix (wHTH) protein